MFVDTKAASVERLLATNAGGTVIVYAASNAAIADLTWAPAWAASEAVAFIHDTYGAAARAIAIPEAPDHPLLTSESTDWYEPAVEHKSVASESHAAAVAANGPAPGPVYISSELTSGGKNAKTTAAAR